MRINLLPVKEIQKYKDEKLFKILKIVLLIFFLLDFSSLGILIFFGKKISTEIKETEQSLIVEKAEDKARELDDIEKKKDELIELLKKAEKISQEDVNKIIWSDVVLELASFLSDGINIQKFEIISEGGGNGGIIKVKISGLAKERDAFLEFQGRLSHSNYYKEVISPISNLTEKENFNFEIILSFK